VKASAVLARSPAIALAAVRRHRSKINEAVGKVKEYLRTTMRVMLLAGDIGGTKTLLGLFDTGDARPRPVAVEELVTLDYAALDEAIEEFLERRGVAPARLTAATFGVAGAITDQVARLTNVPWQVSAAHISRALAVEHVHLLNDLEALAYAVAVLTPDEVAMLQQGVRVASGNAAVIAAGTGLGESVLLNVGGRFVPGESEGGHADFAARTPRELQMVGRLTEILGRVSNEHILSGPGLVNVYQFTHDAFGEPYGSPARVLPSRLCAGVGVVEDPADLPRHVAASAMAERCPQCVEALAMVVEAYGAEAGNLALRTVATAGVYVGGGIAPRILPALRTGSFIRAFRAKEPMDGLVGCIPVGVILNPRAGLLGAAVHASGAGGRGD
jgi:glucokinase